MRVAIYCRLSREDDDKLHENDEALLPEAVQTTDLAIRYTTNASGYYYVKITNNLNGSQSEPTYSLLFKVAQI